MRRNPFLLFVLWVVALSSLPVNVEARHDKANQATPEEFQKVIQKVEAGGAVEARAKKAKAELEGTKANVAMYHALYNKMPFNVTNLFRSEVVKGTNQAYVDPWGSPYEYLIRADFKGRLLGCDLVSLGPDQTSGTGDDIVEHLEIAKGEEGGQSPSPVNRSSLSVKELEGTIASIQPEHVTLIATHIRQGEAEVTFSAPSPEEIFEFLSRLEQSSLFASVKLQWSKKSDQGFESRVVCIVKEGVEVK